MYEWIGEVDKVIKSLTGEMNNNETRNRVASEVIDILNSHKVLSRVDCSPQVNTPEVINHGEFRLVVDTKNITHTFKYVKEKK